MFAFFRRRSTPIEELLPADIPPPWQRLARELVPRYIFVKAISHRKALVHTLEGQEFVLTRYGEHDSDLHARLRRELPYLLELRHPCIVPVLEWNGHESEVWWLRPWVKGQRLHDLLKGHPLDPQQVESWANCLLDALEVSHARGIAHGKVEPKNIWITENAALLSDFARPSELNRIRAGSVNTLGTPLYMAPEILQGISRSQAADGYSLGACLFEALAGQPVFHGDLMVILMSHMTAEPPSLRSIVAEVPQHLDDLVQALLRKKPEERPASPRAAAQLMASARRISVQEASPELQERLSQMQAEGQQEVSDLTFTLDPARALAKLKEFQFAEPEAFIWALCASAHALGCRQLTLQWTPGQLEMHFADVALSKEKLASLWSYAFSRDARGREHRGLRHLALGLAGALGQPGARLQVASSGWGFQLQGLDTPRLKPKKARELWLKIDARFTRVLSTQELLQRFGHSATRLVVAGQAAPQGSKTQPDGSPFWLQPDVREDWQLVVDGLTFPLAPRPQPTGKVIVWDDQLQVDLSYRNVVMNQAYGNLRDRIDPALDRELLKYFQARPIDLRFERHYRHLQKTFGEDIFDPALLQAAELLSEEEFAKHQLVAEAWQRARQLPTPPPDYWPLLRKPFFLDRCKPGWSDVEDYARRLFEPREATVWKLKVCLSWRICQPDPNQLEALLGEIQRQRLEPVFDADLQRYLQRQPPSERRSSWRQLLPPDWVLSRQELE